MSNEKSVKIMVNLEELTAMLDEALANETKESWNKKYQAYLLEGVLSYLEEPSVSNATVAAYYVESGQLESDQVTIGIYKDAA